MDEIEEEHELVVVALAVAVAMIWTRRPVPSNVALKQKGFVLICRFDCLSYKRVLPIRVFKRDGI